MQRLHRVLVATGIVTWRQITADSVERALAKLMAEDRLTAQTRNKYLTAINTFGNWMVRQKRADRNSISAVQRLGVDDAEYRRAMDPHEAARLIAAAEVGPTMEGRTRSGQLRWQMAGQHRALLYRFAWETGLRRGAIERLTGADFELGDDPMVIVRPVANTKNRKLQRIPLRRETADMLREHLASRLPATKAFDLPAKWETADMLRADLTAARAAWIAEGPTAEERAKRADSDFLADMDAEGRRIDFHALRTTCGTWLDAAGVATSTATKITGHSSDRTLRRHYHRSTQEEMRRAVESLPDVRLHATGTDDTNPDPQQYPHQWQRDSARKRATACNDTRDTVRNSRDRKSFEDAEISDAPRNNARPCKSEGDGARTRNLRIDSPVL